MMRNSKKSWRELNLEQLADWDAAPRRYFLMFIAVLLLLLGLYGLQPIYIQYQQTQAKTQELQNQYQIKTQNNERAKFEFSAPEIQAFQPLDKSEMPLFIAKLAIEAQLYHLVEVAIKPVENNAKEAEKNTINPNIVQVLIKVEGSYDDVIKWWAKLSKSSLVLSMDNVELVGIGKNKVRAQTQVSFAQKGSP